MGAEDIAEGAVGVGQRVDADMGVFVVLWIEVGEALDVIPVGVADQQVDLPLVALDQFFAERADPRAGIDNEAGFPGQYLNTGRVAAVAHTVWSRNGIGAADPSKGDLHDTDL